MNNSMPNFTHPFCTGVSRREMLQAGSLSMLGLTLPEFLRAAETSTPKSGAAKSCILMYLEGGPAQQDMWDMKPNSPLEYRGEFQPISTKHPHLFVCEHLPMLARQIHHLAQIRSVHHNIVDHNAGTYYMLTGRSPVSGGKLIIKDEPGNFPPFGSVLSHQRPLKDLPEFVHIPEIMSNMGYDIPGERAGFLGPAFDPLVTGDPSVAGYQIPGLTFPKEMTKDRLTRRRTLLNSVDLGSISPSHRTRGLDSHYEKAYELLASSKTKQAFDLDQESITTRERYGLPDRIDRSVEARKFGGLPHLGQCLLLSRRLIEAGVRLVTVCTGRRIDQTWDGHRKHFALLKRSILPYFDCAFSALLEDLAARDLLKETLVVAMGEFGRTPKMGQTTSNAGATSAGRDHWPHCYTVLMGGAGIKPGFVYGESDRYAGYPISNAVTPEQIAATIYYALGIDSKLQLFDSLNRPHSLTLAEPILDLFE